MAKKKPYRYVLYLAARLVTSILYLLPRSWALGFARWAGRLSFRMVERQRSKIMENLKSVYGGKFSAYDRHQMGQKVMEHMVQNAVELLQFPKFTGSNIDGIVQLGSSVETYRSLLAEGKGLISITAHLGNWELLAGVFGLKGFPGAVVGREIYYAPYNQWVVALREAVGVRTIYRNQAAREILRLLRGGHIVGILPDQDIDSLPGIFVPFFGRPAYTTTAPAKLAITSGAPIVTNFLIRLPNDQYKVVIGEVIRPDTKQVDDHSVKRLTETWMKSFEEVISTYPEQWVWMHDRWKTKPKKEPVSEPAEGIRHYA